MTVIRLRPLVLIGCLLSLTHRVLAQDVPGDTPVRLGGFLDLYVAWDGNRPLTLDRAYTTTAARHAEFNVNLAYVDLAAAGDRMRGRLAIQYGTSVQANYAGEPRLGTLSGPELSRYLQEATVGVRLAEHLWTDVGVFFAPFGAESWISRDNLTYTRSLIADYSPYYESGVRLVWSPSSRFSGQLHVINGWQNISETNADKALAIRTDWTPVNGVTVTYDAFLGNEQPDTLPRRMRSFQEVVVQWTPTPRWTMRTSVDLGREARVGGGAAWWRGTAVIVQRRLAPTVAAVARAESYSDPERVILQAPGTLGARMRGVSLGLDVTPAPRTQWRTEWRALSAHEAIFPGAGGPTHRNGVIVTAITMTF